MRKPKFAIFGAPIFFRKQLFDRREYQAFYGGEANHLLKTNHLMLGKPVILGLNI